MNKPKSTLKNILLSILLVVTVLSGLLVGVYLLVEKHISQAEDELINNAVRDVLPSFDNNPCAESYKVAVDGGKDSLVFYPASKQGEQVGIAVSSYTEKGFGGHIALMVGFLSDGSIYDTKVLSHNETQGLGAKLTSTTFRDQFKGKFLNGLRLRMKKDEGDVDGITAATVSSRAFCDALARAYKAYTHDNDVEAETGASKGGGHE